MTRPKPTVIHTWQELAQRAKDFSGGAWLFRGVTRQCHELIPSVGREKVRHDGLTNKIRPFNKAEERQILEAFKLKARPHITYALKADVGWLAVGQHHRLVTRLLDWTESLFVAAYFATEKGDILKKSRIYCINELNIFDSKLSVFDIDRPYTYRPPHISPRIPAQQAVFTVHHEPAKPLESDDLQIEIIDIPGRCCIHLKRMLDVAGFNRASLFPDIDGLGVHLSWRYKWNWRL